MWKPHLVIQITNLHPNFHTLFPTHIEYHVVEVVLAPMSMSIEHIGNLPNGHPNKTHKNMPNL
jgi:hypothetical protein